MISIVVNGHRREVVEGTTLATLMTDLDMPIGIALAIERNRVVVPRSEWSAVQVLLDDVVEIVSLVGGG